MARTSAIDIAPQSESTPMEEAFKDCISADVDQNFYRNTPRFFGNHNNRIVEMLERASKLAKDKGGGIYESHSYTQTRQ